MEPSAYFSAEFFEFLTDLRRHNEREWFERNKSHYEAAVREPLFAANRGTQTAASENQSEYRCRRALWHGPGQEGSGPAYYLHFEPGSGIWRPPAEALIGIRDAIVADPKSWQNITNGADFRSTCGMAGESLKKAPAGYDPHHPLIDDIERKDLTTSGALTDRQVCAPGLLDTSVNGFRATAWFVEFLAVAVGRK